MEVKVIINAAEWSFEEEIPFDITSIALKDEDFEMPLFDENGDETEVVNMPSCSVLELKGEEDEFHVVMEKSIIEEADEFENEEGVLVKSFTFFVDKPLWKQGEDIGVFYSWENLPEELKNLSIKS